MLTRTAALQHLHSPPKQRLLLSDRLCHCGWGQLGGGWISHARQRLRLRRLQSSRTGAVPVALRPLTSPEDARLLANTRPAELGLVTTVNAASCDTQDQANISVYSACSPESMRRCQTGSEDGCAPQSVREHAMQEPQLVLRRLTLNETVWRICSVKHDSCGTASWSMRSKRVAV